MMVGEEVNVIFRIIYILLIGSKTLTSKCEGNTERQISEREERNPIDRSFIVYLLLFGKLGQR